MFHPIPIANWFAQLAQGDSEVRQEAIEGVHELEPPILAAVPTLARLLTQTAPTPLRCMGIGHPGYVRHAAARALWQLGRKDLAIPVLVELLRVSVGYLRRLAVITLGHIGPLARRELNRVIASSHDPDAGVRSAAIEALARIGGAGQVPAIICALDDEDQFVRLRAAEWLGRTSRNARVAIGRLKRMVAEGAPFDRLAASAALWHICRWPHTAATFVETLRSTDVDLRLAAIRSFADLPSAPKRAIAALESALNDDNRFVRRDAATALAEMNRGE